MLTLERDGLVTRTVTASVPARVDYQLTPLGERPAAQPTTTRHSANSASYASPVRIEPLPERLYDAAVRLWQDSGLTRPWNDPEADLLRAVGGGSSCVLAAIGNNDALLATAMVGHDGHRGWVYYLAVDAAQRGRGLGRQMMEVCEDWVRSRGIPKIQLMVRETNRVATGFYEHLGYAESEVVVLARRLDG
jgi:ribosomal protein S18 acetylase RimI-like enzyme